MKGYKRLTERDDSLCIDCADIGFCRKTCISQARYERLQFLENEIESGEIDYVADRDKQIARLTAENAELRATLSKMETVEKELRARLDNAVELPAKVGDRVFYINGFAPDFAPAAVEEFEIEEILIQKSTTIFRLIGVDTGIKTVVFLSWYNKMWFTELEAAEARLNELKGEKK